MLNTFFFRSRLRAVSHGVYLPSISESSGISCFVRRPRKMQIESNYWGQSKLKFLLPYLLFYPLISVKTDGKITPSVSNRDPPACDPAREQSAGVLCWRARFCGLCTLAERLLKKIPSRYSCVGIDDQPCASAMHTESL